MYTDTKVYGPHSFGSNGNSASAAHARVFTHDVDGQAAPSEVVDVVLRMHSELVEYGRKRAELSRDIEPNVNDLRALQEHAEAMANEAYREPYDPEQNEEHKLREAEYQKFKSIQPEAELAVSYGEADVAKLVDEVSRAQSNMKAPTTQQVLMWSAVAGLALTIAPTLHDYVFITIRDDLTNWALSLLSATVYGVFITWGLLDSEDEGGRRTARNRLGFAGGIVVPIGLGILRAANAVGIGEILFAVALTIVEIGIVVLLEGRASSLRVAYQEWAAQQATLRDVTTRLEEGRFHLTRCGRKLKEINDAIDAHIRLVTELTLRNYNIDKVKEDAVRAVKDGYFEGLASNRGYLRGVRR